MSATLPSEAPTGSPAGGQANGPASGRGVRDVLRRFMTMREASIIVITLIAFAYFAITASRFLSIDSFKNLLPYFAPFAIFAAGEVFVMINGEIDISVGALYLFIPFWFHQIHTWGVPLYLALILALVSAGAIGAANGFMVAVIGVPSLVATLGTLFTFSGLTLVMSHSTPVTPPGSSLAVTHLPTFEQIFGHGTYSEFFWALGIIFILQVMLTFTRWGIYTVAVGSNRVAAAESGINVRLVLVRNFVVCALLAGFVGILETTRATSITPDPSGPNSYLLLAIAAAVIGGTLLQGGSGTVIGALLGALFLGILQDGLVFKGVSADHRDLYLGLAIVIAVILNTYVGRARRGAGHG
jgi:simple sugar transport system permease protein